ncbi:MAG: LuxR C-terminal-related transcriptional regulator [Cyanobacteria bacterium J06639_16]
MTKTATLSRQPKIQLTQQAAQHSANLLSAMLEALSDGILMISPGGELLHANCCAVQLCRQLISTQGDLPILPPAIWRICESLIESRSLFPNQIFVIEDEIRGIGSTLIRIRVQWIDIDAVDHPCLLVTLEDRNQSAKTAALAEAQRYQLTQRETEVWLLRRAKYNYEEIADQLFISINTVKKHLKSIYAKRNQALDCEAC